MLVGAGLILAGAYIVLVKLSAYRDYTEAAEKKFAERVAMSKQLTKAREQEVGKQSVQLPPHTMDQSV